VVETYPLSDDPAVRSLHRTGVAVCEVFAAALREQQVMSRCSTIRVFLHLADPSRDDGRVHVEVHDAGEGFDSANATIPARAAALSRPARALLVLDVLSLAAARLGDLRGWEPHVVPVARKHALEHGLTFTWSGPWKSSRDRRLEARATYGIDDDGGGHAAIELRRAGEDDPFTWSGRAQAYPTVEGFRRSARTLRWRTPEQVVLVPYSGLVGAVGAPLELLVDAVPASVVPRAGGGSRPSEDTPRPVVVLVTKDASHREIRAIGGGPTNDVPRTWHQELYRLWDLLEGRDWAAWWAGAGVSVLELSWDGMATDDRVVVRRGKDKLVARIEHRPGSVPASDGVETARRDMEALVAAVRRREGLGEPPPLA
jgi:hypothetical protein